jgi:hypothetical protein
MRMAILAHNLKQLALDDHAQATDSRNRKLLSVANAALC